MCKYKPLSKLLSLICPMKENVLVDHREEVRISDFGLSVLLDKKDTTCSGTWTGTIRFQPPEYFRLEADGPTKEGDVYTFGMTVLV